MSYTKIVHIGGGGDLGQSVLKRLVDSAKFDITVLARESSSYVPPYPTVKVQKLDLFNHDALVSAFQGADALVLTHSGFGNIENTTKIFVEAAIVAGVKRVIPSDFGTDLFNPPGSEHVVYAEKHRVDKYLIQKAADNEIEFTSICIGPFFDWGLVKWDFLGYNIPNRTAVIYDDGNAKFNTTTLDSVGQAVVGVLSNPSATLNRQVRVHDFSVSQNEILAQLEELVGEKFTITKALSEEVEEQAEAALKKDEFTRANITAYFQAVMFGKVSSARWDVNDDSTLLGLDKKNLKEEIRKVL